MCAWARDRVPRGCVGACKTLFGHGRGEIEFISWAELPLSECALFLLTEQTTDALSSRSPPPSHTRRAPSSGSGGPIAWPLFPHDWPSEGQRQDRWRRKQTQPEMRQGGSAPRAAPRRRRTRAARALSRCVCVTSVRGAPGAAPVYLRHAPRGEPCGRPDRRACFRRGAGQPHASAASRAAHHVPRPVRRLHRPSGDRHRHAQHGPGRGRSPLEHAAASTEQAEARLPSTFYLAGSYPRPSTVPDEKKKGGHTVAWMVCHRNGIHAASGMYSAPLRRHRQARPPTTVASVPLLLPPLSHPSYCIITYHAMPCHTVPYRTTPCHTDPGLHTNVLCPLHEKQKPSYTYNPIAAGKKRSK